MDIKFQKNRNRWEFIEPGEGYPPKKLTDNIIFKRERIFSSYNHERGKDIHSHCFY